MKTGTQETQPCSGRGQDQRDTAPSQGMPGVAGSQQSRRGQRALPMPCLQSSGLQDSERINSCCFSHPGSGHLFRHPQDTDARSRLSFARLQSEDTGQVMSRPFFLA